LRLCTKLPTYQSPGSLTPAAVAHNTAAALCSWLIAIAYWLAGGFIKSGKCTNLATHFHPMARSLVLSLLLLLLLLRLLLVLLVLYSWLIAIAYWLAGGFIKSGMCTNLATHFHLMARSLLLSLLLLLLSLLLLLLLLLSLLLLLLLLLCVQVGVVWAEPSRRGPDDSKQLHQLSFQTGDFLDVAIL
jgi:hypothetical protein